MADNAALTALNASLAALDASGRDKAAMQLARRYAKLLDDAALPSAFRSAFGKLAPLVSSKAEVAALEKIRDALSAHTVASDIGPKYLAVLVQLGLTPAARGVKAGLNSTEPPVEPPPSPEPEPVVPDGNCDELRKRREERIRGRTADSG